LAVSADSGSDWWHATLIGFGRSLGAVSARYLLPIGPVHGFLLGISESENVNKEAIGLFHFHEFLDGGLIVVVEREPKAGTLLRSIMGMHLGPVHKVA
jgi:hypothetical protein